MDIGGPLRGTWLTVLVISIAFAAAGVAAAEPWSAPVGAALSADSIPPASVSSTDGAGTLVLPRTEGTPSSVGSEPADALEATASSDDVTSDEVALWERQENHGFYVSSQAKDTAGTGNGCGVSSVARSEVGKPDSAKSDPSSSTSACKEPAAASVDGNNGKGKGAPDERDSDSSDKGKGKGASDDGDGE